MRLILSLIGFMLTLGVVVALLAVGWGWSTYQAQGPATEPQQLIIERGQGVGAIADRLAADGIIDNPLLFRIMARLSGQHTQLKAGEYVFPAQVSMAEVLAILTEGDVVQRRITIREGLTSWQVVQILNDVEILTGEITEIPPEGSLLPETYAFMHGEDRNALIARMQAAMTRTLDELWTGRGDNAPDLSAEEVVILASIIEKETGVAAEREKVAGVFVNRLSRGMPLQTDPTVIYALTGGRVEDEGMGPLGRRLLRADLQYDSPYNTYRYPGLPPGPIANPGRASIVAALNPERHNYLYFVADGTGGHMFGRTLDEHNRNVRAWRRIRDSGNN